MLLLHYIINSFKNLIIGMENYAGRGQDLPLILIQLYINAQSITCITNTIQQSIVQFKELLKCSLQIIEAAINIPLKN